WAARHLCLLLLGEVVDRDAADGLRLEVGGHPGGDRRRAVAAAEAVAALPDEVVDLALGDHRLELGQRGGRVGAVEAADRHHRVAAGGELDRRGRLRADGRRGPLVPRRVLLKQLDQRAADLGAAGQAAHRDAAEAAGAAGAAGAGPGRAALGAGTRSGARSGPAGRAGEAPARAATGEAAATAARAAESSGYRWPGARDRAGVRGAGRVEGV